MFAGTFGLMGQAKKPTIMIVPSNFYMSQHGYGQEVNSQGSKVFVPDYDKAFRDDINLKLVITSLNGMMTNRGFPPKILESSLATLRTDAARDMVTTSKSGSEINESPLDQLNNIAKADIIMDLTYNLNSRGPFKSVTFILEGRDAYTNKPVGYATGTGPENASAVVPVLLETAVLAHIDNFNTSLQSHFDDLFTNGREMTFKVKVFNTFDGNLESEFGGTELADHIEEWVDKNTVKGRFNLSDVTETAMNFEQVRIPLFNDKGRALDSRSWVNELKKLLKDQYKIDSKVITKGLGQVTLVIGEK